VKNRKSVVSKKHNTVKSVKNTKFRKQESEYRKELQEAVDAFIMYGGITAASNQLGLPRSTVQYRFDSAVRDHIQPSPAALKSAGLKRPRSIPYSEDEEKYKDWTPQQCLEELQRIVRANPDKAISRNFFRVFSSISESTWNKHFGTFHEFKRQAGVILSRHQHKHERHVARHASVDQMRDLTVEKKKYEGKYEKPNDKRWQDILVGSDIHDIDCDPFWRRTFIDTAKRLQPEIICLNGDVFDLPEFSRFTQDPSEWQLIEPLYIHLYLQLLQHIHLQIE